jgi:hypothetical protein
MSTFAAINNRYYRTININNNIYSFLSCLNL